MTPQTSPRAQKLNETSAGGQDKAMLPAYLTDFPYLTDFR